MISDSLSCFKAYDIRGQVPSELNEDTAYKIGLAYSAFLNPKQVIVGRDIRMSSPDMANALIRGLTESGVDVFDIGICGTEEVYFSVFQKNMDGGVMVTASHNPSDYNGMKLVREKSRPINEDTGLQEIKKIILNNSFKPSSRTGSISTLENRDAYLKHILSYTKNELKPLKVVVNAGNGCAGPIIDRLEKHLPFEFIKINNEPDGTFPNGVPNPLLVENRGTTIDAIKLHNADIGIAWDGDFDRCFFFDETGRFIEGYYVVGILAANVLQSYPGSKIIYDPRLTWNSIEMVKNEGGIAIQSKSGHAFMKEVMRKEDAIYGGEMSAHHYFRDFSYCDSGMIPWLMVLDIMSKTGKKFSEMVSKRIELFPASGEINRKIKNPDAAIKNIEDTYKNQALKVEYIDGISMEFPLWRFNLRKSNTEPLLRLNVETRGNIHLMEEKTREILEKIDSLG